MLPMMMTQRSDNSTGVCSLQLLQLELGHVPAAVPAAAWMLACGDRMYRIGQTSSVAVVGP